MSVLRAVRSLSPVAQSQIGLYASFPQTSVSLHQMVGTSSDRLTQFLSEELPIRFAKRFKELDELPKKLRDVTPLRTVKEWYAQSFEDLVTMSRPPIPQNSDFIEMLESIKIRHDPIVDIVAQDSEEWKRAHKARSLPFPAATWLDRFQTSRIGLRFLVDQYASLRELRVPRTKLPHEVGHICNGCNPHNVVQHAIDRARAACTLKNGFEAPQVELIAPPELTFAYVPSHLYFICTQIIQNSLQAVIDLYGSDRTQYLNASSILASTPPKSPLSFLSSWCKKPSTPPPIQVFIVQGKEDICIRFSDVGGGVPRSALPLIWTWLGNGLPLARVYARLFGGDLKLSSMEGDGTNVYLHLNRLSPGREALEW